MEFQQKTAGNPSIGVAGQEVNPGNAVFTSFTYMSDGTVEAGKFAFVGDGEEGSRFNVATAKKSDGKLLGFVARAQTGVINSPLTSSANTYNKGMGVPIALRGAFYMQVPSSQTPKEGQAVLCNPADGAITFGKAGDTNDTGWVVRLPQGVKTVAQNTMIIIEHFGVQVTTAASPGVPGAAAAVVGESNVGEATVADKE